MSRHFPKAQNTNFFNFTFDITQEMMPEANVIVFYVREQDGEIIFDNFIIELGFKTRNFVSLIESLCENFSNSHF
jgi:uncharacterized protein with ATP-grasp and redox domains